MEWNNFSNLGARPCEKHFCKIILKLSHWLERECGSIFFLILALVAILIKGVEPF